MENQDLIVKMLQDLKIDFNTFCNKNDAQHNNIIARQDKTNGSVAKIKRGQIILWTALSTTFVVLAVLGLVPERLFNLIKGVV